MTPLEIQTAAEAIELALLGSSKCHAVHTLIANGDRAAAAQAFLDASVLRAEAERHRWFFDLADTIGEVQRIASALTMFVHAIGFAARAWSTADSLLDDLGIHGSDRAEPSPRPARGQLSLPMEGA